MARLPDKTDRRLHLLVGLVVSAGLAVNGYAGFTLWAALRAGAEQPAAPVIVAIVALVAVGDLVMVRIRVRSTGHGFGWADAAILIGLALVPVEWVVLATTVGVALARALRRQAPLKLMFAVSKDVIFAFTAGIILLLLDFPDSSFAAGVWMLALAYAVIALVDPLLALPVIALASRTRIRDRFRANWDIRLVTNAGRLAVALAAVLALELAPTLIYTLPLAVILAHLWHERWLRGREERQAWQHLADATKEFTGVDLDAVLHAAVVRGAKLFTADELEVEVWLESGRRLVRGAEEIVYDGDPRQAPVDDHGIYAVALHGYHGRGDIGALRLRYRSEVGLTEREEAMAGSYAAALETAVRNAAAYQRLGEATQAHAYAAAHDALTGLANRRELERQLVAALASPSGTSCRIAVMLLDLRHFKEVNDAFGHLAGDRVLEQLAQRMVAAAGPNDLVARFGGDEFAVVLRSAWRPARVEARAKRVLATLSDQLEVDGLPIVVEANGGLALAFDPQDDPEPDAEAALAEEVGPYGAGPPEDEAALAEEAGAGSPGEPGQGERGGSDEAVRAGPAAAGEASGAGGVADLPEPSAADQPGFRRTPEAWMAELLRRADVALYQAKRSGATLVCYSAAADPADRDRLLLAGQLPRAVSQREFVLHFQPIVDLVTGEVVGAEALARWRHPTRGELVPGAFLDLLERSAHLPAFTNAVLDDALSAADVWRAAGYDLRISVNISSRSLLDTTLPEQVLTALDRHRTRPDRLCLELTETLALSQLETVDRVLTQLYDIGVQLALDDFGTGYSSLAVLSRIPVHVLKIDQSFVQSLRELGATAETSAGDPAAVGQAKAVVRATVQLGRALGLTVVAEGVEAETQRQLLWELGCQVGQGHLFGRAQPAEQLLAQLTRGVGGRPGALATPLPEDSTVVPLRTARSPRRRAG